MKKILFLMMINMCVFATAYADFTRNATTGIVTDSRTGLMWQDDAVSSTMTWSAAITYCEDKVLGGYSDWRLPNQRELLSIADRSRYNPATNSVFVNTASDGYWSSTANVGSTGYAWGVSFDGGYTYANIKNNDYYARCVRSGQ